MQIQYNFHRQNENDKTVFFTLTDDQPKEYKFHGDIANSVIDIQMEITVKIRWYLRCIRLKEYPSAKSSYLTYAGDDELEKIENWIIDHPTVQPRAIKNTHPKICNGNNVIEMREFNATTVGLRDLANVVGTIAGDLKGAIVEAEE